MGQLSISTKKLGANFWSLWTAAGFSNLGDGIYKFVLPVLAARMTDSPTLVASVSFALTLPWLLFSLPAGAMVDRMDRKKVMIVTNICCAAIMAFLFLGTFSEHIHIAILLAVSFLLGTCETLSVNASGALVPAIVPRDRLEQANSRIVSIETIMNNFVGKPVAGFLITISAPLALASGTAVCFIAIMALMWLRGTFKADRTGNTTIANDIREGIGYLWNHRLLRTLAAMVAVMSCCWSGFFAVLILYALSEKGMGLSEFQYSFLLTALAAGGLAGASLVMPIQRLLGKRWLLGLDIVGTIVMLLTPAITTNVFLVGIAIFMGGFGGGTWNVAVNSIRQSMVPNELLGRVYSAYRLVGWGTLALGALLAGVISQWLGVQTFFLLAALANVSLFIPMLKVLTNENLRLQMKAES
jgi:MFS family permease